LAWISNVVCGPVSLVAVFGVMRQHMPRWAIRLAQYSSSWGWQQPLRGVPLDRLAWADCNPVGALDKDAGDTATYVLAWDWKMVGLWAMDLGLRWILGVAHFVADRDGALRHVMYRTILYDLIGARIFGNSDLRVVGQVSRR
jgi:competence protein ComEC